jgi:hypothetical protein
MGSVLNAHDDGELGQQLGVLGVSPGCPCSNAARCYQALAQRPIDAHRHISTV